MKKLILSCLATASILALSNCRSRYEHEHHDRHHRGSTTTTTTEETTLTRPSSQVTETQTIRSY